MNQTIRSLAKSRITYYKSRSVLTAVAIMLTAALLMGLVSGALGVFDISRKQAVASGNHHAVFQNVSEKQLEQLAHHLDVEALDAVLPFATVISDNMAGMLLYKTTYKEGIYQGTDNLVHGRFPKTADEICGPPAFFERMGTEPAVGGKITIPFRMGGRGLIQTRKFTICGLTSQPDLSGMNINNSRIAYSAVISEALVREYPMSGDGQYNAFVRVYGEESLHYDEMEEKINAVGTDIGCEEKDISFNTQYLSTMTALSAETTAVVAAISLIILFFSALVIYSIYYVSVITDIQELGRLKALGASKKQVKKLLLWESMRLSAIAIPAGMLLGYAIPAAALPAIADYIAESVPTAFAMGRLRMFSLPASVAIVLAILLTVRISVHKPLHMAGKISPVEAFRYQESASCGGTRKGHRNVSLFRLAGANLFRNRKRTFVTMMTMGLSCVLFISFSAVLNSMAAENIARATLPEGDFRLSLDCRWDDKEYPENNFDMLQTKNLFDEDLLEKIRGIDGVTKIKRDGYILLDADPSIPYFAEERKNIAPISRAEAESLRKDVLYGDLDYDKMLAENGAIFTSDWLWDEAGLSVGESLPVTLYDGDIQIPFTITISAVVKTENDYGCFMIPEELWAKLPLQYDTTCDLYIYADRSGYENVKAALQEIAAENDRFDLYSIDEEMELGRLSLILVKLPMYVILIMVALIGCINLINTMITGIVTRKKELGILQAVGLSDGQLRKMLAGEGLFFTAGTLFISVTVGNLFGYLVFLWAKNHRMLGVWTYHYPLRETIGLAAFLIAGQLLITGIMNRRMHRESLIDRIRSGE